MSKFRNVTEHRQTIYKERIVLFHGMQHDMSLMAERVALTLMQDMGFHSPRSASAVLYINGHFDGLYNLIEQVDQAFTKRVFGNDTMAGRGTLYKEAWPLYDGPQPIQAKAIGSRGADRSGIFLDLRRTAQMCLALGPDRCTPDLAASILDMFTQPESFINGLVAAGILSNWDQPVTFFCWGPAPEPCASGRIVNHNFYIYVEDEKLSLIPWDYTDALLSVCGFNSDLRHIYTPYDPSLCHMPPWFEELRPQDEARLCRQGTRLPGSNRTFKTHFTCDPVAKLMIRAWRGRILQRVQDLAGDSPHPSPQFPGGKILGRFNNLLDEWEVSYKGFLQKDIDDNGSVPDMSMWRRSLTRLKEVFAGNLGIWRATLGFLSASDSSLWRDEPGGGRSQLMGGSQAIVY